MRKNSFAGISFLLCALSVSAVFAAAQSPQKPATVTGEGKKTEIGVRYWDVKAGTGGLPKEGELVTVHYTCWLPDGKEIDSSVGHNPLNMFGARNIAWIEGMVGMRVGGKRQLRIPPEWAHPAMGNDPLPPNTELICDLEMLGRGVQATLPPEAQEAFDRGLAAVEQKDWELAVKYFSKAQEPPTAPNANGWDEEQPGNTYPNLLLNLGLAHGKAGHELAAIAWLQAYLAAAPKAANADAVRKQIARLDVAAESKIAAVIRLAYDTAGKVQSDAHRPYLLGQVADAQAYTGDLQSAIAVKMANDRRRMAMLWSFYALGQAESDDFEGAKKAADTAGNYADSDSLRSKDVDLMHCIIIGTGISTPYPSMRMTLTLHRGLKHIFWPWPYGETDFYNLPITGPESPLKGDLLAAAMWSDVYAFYNALTLNDGEAAEKAIQQMPNQPFIPTALQHPPKVDFVTILPRILDFAGELSKTDEVVSFDVTLKTAGVSSRAGFTELESYAIEQTGIAWVLTKDLYYLRGFNRELAAQTRAAGSSR